MATGRKQRKIPLLANNHLKQIDIYPPLADIMA